MKKFDRIVDILFYILVIVWLSFLGWTIKTAEPTIIYIEVPQVQEEIVIIEEPEIDILEELPIPVIESRYGFTDDDIYLMATLLSGSKYVDGDGEFDIDFDGHENHQQISLVLNVVMNRINSEQFPNTVSEVIWAPGQFTVMPQWSSGLPEVSDISLDTVREWCMAYDTYDPDCQTIPDSHLYFYSNGIVNKSRERWY